MAQIGNVHPDTLVPFWHASRQLTPEEAETVGRLIKDHVDEHISERLFDQPWWLEAMPPIPPRRTDRCAWVIGLTGRAADGYYAYHEAERHVAKLRDAVRHQDLRAALRLMTESQPFEVDPRIGDYRPEWRRQLQDIRDALETRIDDAIEQAVAAKATEIAAAP